MSKLILFDIDGTLISSGGAGTRALNKSFNEIFSIPDGFKGVRMAGKTDIEIMKEGMFRHNINPEDKLVKKMVNGYIYHLGKEINNNGRHLKPGIKEIINKLKNVDGFYLGLLTGNLEKGARLKLEPFGINPYFPFGAFGSDDENRNRLLPIALKKFSDIYKISIMPEDTVVIGDTPRDVACSKPFGAFSVVVATGPYSFEKLQNSGADLVLKDLRDQKRLIDSINNIS
ncbi:MAG: HAD family hydrolase [Nitrospirota bacterium]|jgi:phosphoglycolate phosphatase-like HAD superfamily hydrolase